MSKKALIVEDDDMTIMCLKNFLKQEGFTADAVENGEGAIGKLKEGSYDLILVDYNLPDMAGDQVLSKIKENGGSYGKSILMSGDDDLKSQFESKGINFFLHKPVKKPQFKELAGKLGKTILR